MRQEPLYYVTRHNGRAADRPRRIVFIGTLDEAKVRFSALVPRTLISYAETVLWKGPPPPLGGFSVWRDNVIPDAAELLYPTGEEAAMEAYFRRQARAAKLGGLRVEVAERVRVEPERLRVEVSGPEADEEDAHEQPTARLVRRQTA